MKINLTEMWRNREKRVVEEEDERVKGEHMVKKDKIARNRPFWTTAGFFFFHFCIFIYIIFPKIYDISYP